MRQANTIFRDAWALARAGAARFGGQPKLYFRSALQLTCLDYHRAKLQAAIPANAPVIAAVVQPASCEVSPCATVQSAHSVAGIAAYSTVPTASRFVSVPVSTGILMRLSNAASSICSAVSDIASRLAGAWKRLRSGAPAMGDPWSNRGSGPGSGP